MVRMTQADRASGAKLQAGTLQAAVCRKAATIGLKLTCPFKPKQAKTMRKPGSLSLIQICHYQKSDGGARHYSQSIDGELCMSCVLGYTAFVLCINIIRDFWGMFVRVYPWIVQGLTFLSAWKTRMYINNYNTCSFVVQVDTSFIC